MTGRRASLAIALALGSFASTGCYDVPLPACGFYCGEDGACPAEYSCDRSRWRCRLDGTSPSLDCPATEPEPSTPPPFVSRTDPAHGQQGVPVTITLQASFSKPVFGVSAETFTLVDQVTQMPVPAIVAYNPNTFTATLDPTPQLAPTRTYLAQLSTSIIDIDGQPLLDQSRSWSFMTQDTAPSGVVAHQRRE